MSVTDQKDGQHSLSREWLVAQIVVGGGVLVAILAVAYFGWVQPIMQQRDAASRAQLLASESAAAATLFCTSGLAAAQNYGIVPPYGQLVGRNIYLTRTRGRYVCVAATHATRYLVAIDLFCHDLKNKRCISLFSVTQANGNVLYQRQS
jgi:hypothetical protein